ncbi:MAG: type VI secretion system ATPase TssH [Candidatus Riflebacteria bacterium]|nr:type VI secretion system ATPase TssH [Candidatus Riflebacteria bacterium]
MGKLKRIQLFSKLNQKAYKAVEAATILCKTRGNPYVELIHWINQIVLAENTDWNCAIRYFGLDEAKLAKDLTAAMDALPRGASSITDFSGQLELAIKESWMIASLVFNESAIRTGHLLVGLKQSPELSRTLLEISMEFAKINADILQQEFRKIVEDSSEASVAAPAGESKATGQAGSMMSNPAMGKGEALRLYTVDMTEKAKSGKIDPIVGRDEEIRKIIDILMRRRQNNPILTGDAGVGKTAIVEGFAQRLASGDVPDCLKGTVLRSLDIGLLQAGASMKGEFENRLKQVIEEVQNSETPIILFIDEAHTLIGAGGAAGQNDAANLLKPALARGELRCVAATTWQEYVKYFEKDPALTRRFQNILVDEPDDDKATQMMRGMIGALEKHHKVLVLDEALKAAVTLSRRYIPARQLPDKAVSILDTACARVAMSQNTEPAPLEFSRRKISALELEIEILKREQASGCEHTDKIKELEDKLEKEKANKEDLEKRNTEEKALVQQYITLRDKLRDSKDNPSEEDTKALKECGEKLKALQGENPMVFPQVDTQAVSTIISEWTGIPLGRMVKNEIQSILSLGDEMNKRVIGQRHGLDLLAKRIQTSRASLADPNRPIAVVMLAGPSGVGKTETALTLAEQIYGSEENLITINMSEFQEAHTVSTLKGAPPGYVGYGEGGVLTEAVRRKPYSVVLLDEIEKAHPDVHEIFFQVFDKGQMEDGEGRMINFRNTLIILTTNVGDNIIMDMCQDEENLPTCKEMEEAVRPAMLKVFPAALLGRISIIPYYPLGRKSLNSIIDLKLNKIVKRVKENYNAELIILPEVRDEIISRCNNIQSGARLIDAIINNDLLPEVSAEFLKVTMDGGILKTATVGAAEGKFTFNFELKE